MLIYTCTNRLSGKVYVGKTSASVRQRWTEHQSSARRGSPYLFHRAIRKYGAEAFEVQVIATASSEEELSNLEVRFIEELGARVPGGYNLREGGEGGVHSQETIEAIRANALGRRWTPEAIERLRSTMTGEGNPFFGKHHTEETKVILRQKCGLHNIGKKLTPEQKEKFLAGSRGKPRSEEHSRRLSDALMGRTLSEEHRQAISRGGRGRPKPEGFGEKVSAAQKGRPKPEATKQKLREAALRRHRGGHKCQ